MTNELPQVGLTEFGPVAPYYDDLMRSVPYSMWVGYLLLLHAHLDVRPKVLLDVCCGTGTMAEMLWKEGKEVDGLDLAPGMIDRANAKASELGVTRNYVVADASDFNMGKTYEGAYSFFDSLNYILDMNQLRKAFECVFRHLKPGGSWIFDLNTSYAFEQEMFDQKSLSPRGKIRYNWKGDYDASTRIIRVDMTFWYGDQEFHETHYQRAHDIWEVREMLQEVGFSQVDVFHSYTLEPHRAKSDRVHFACLRS